MFYPALQELMKENLNARWQSGRAERTVERNF